MWPKRGGSTPSASEELEVLRRVGKVILAANDVRDLHLDVVHDIHEMEDPRAVRAADRHVAA